MRNINSKLRMLLHNESKGKYSELIIDEMLTLNELFTSLCIL